MTTIKSCSCSSQMNKSGFFYDFERNIKRLYITIAVIIHSLGPSSSIAENVFKILMKKATRLMARKTRANSSAV